MERKFNTGLVSISFRNKSTEEIIDLCCKNELEYVEWGSDIHVPAGEHKIAGKVFRMMEDSGLKTSSYGSYYKLGKDMDFSPYLESAIILGAPSIRIWAGDKSSADVDEREYEKIILDGRRCVEEASRHGIKVAFEYHRNTYTDKIDAAIRISKDTRINLNWQPNPEISLSEKLEELKRMESKPEIVHVFAWSYQAGRNIRHLLATQEEEWKTYINLIGRKSLYLLEFFKDDNIENVQLDAVTLKKLLA